MSESILDFEIDQKVEKFAEAINDTIIKNYPHIELTITGDSAENTDHTLRAQRIYLKTDHGVVIVMPDFNNRSAAACVVNVRLWRWMSMEGFDDEAIDREGKLLSNPLPHTDSNVEILSYYLSHKNSGS
jgi:hypothetical protein